MKKLPLPKEIDKILESNIDELLNIVLEDAKRSQMIPVADPKKYKDEIREQVIVEIEKSCQEFNQRFRVGMEQLVKELRSIENGSESAGKAFAEIEAVLNSIAPFQDHIESFGKRMDKSNTLQEFLGISNESINEFYRAAHSLHQANKFDEAANSFYFLSVINPLVFEFWMGYAHSEQMLGRFESALYAYATAVQLNNTNPDPHILAAECYYQLNEIPNAINSAEIAIACAEVEKNQQTLQVALELKKTLENQ